MAINDLHTLPVSSPAKRSKFTHRPTITSSSSAFSETVTGDGCAGEAVKTQTDKCPFATAFASHGNVPNFAENKGNYVQRTAPSFPVNHGVNHNSCVGLGPQRLKDAFPFHIAVSKDFKVIQIGPKLAQLILDSKIASIYMNVFIGKFFTISTPPDFPWDWNQLRNLEDSTIEVTLNHSKKKISFRGTMMFLDPLTDSSVMQPSCLFLLNPHIFNLNDINELNLKLSDFPSHNFQRDLLIIGKFYTNKYSLKIVDHEFPFIK
jgi:hypothetical protein